MVSIWTKRGRLVLGAIGLFLVSAPVIGAHLLISAHTRQQAEDDINEIAADVIERAELAIDSGLTTLTELSLVGVSRCTERDLDLMRRAVYSNYSIKEVGVSDADGNFLCNHIGDLITVRKLSEPYPSRNRSVTLQLVELGTNGRTGVMLAWSFAEGGGLSAVVPSEALASDLLPKDIRALASGQMRLPDGTVIGALPGRDPAAAETNNSRLISAEVRSSRYPLVMSMAVPYSAYLERNSALLTYARLGGVLISTLIFGLLLYVLRGPPSEVARLSEAAARGEFVPYYQPVIDIKSGRLVGCEVLMRWLKPNGVVIAPNEFIRLAEASGLAGPMTLQLMHKTRADLNDAFGRRPSLKISFNLFDAHFASLRTVRDFASIFEDSQISFGQLIFEVTERQPLADIKRARVIIRRLQELGARVALDDAGAGHAGLAYLQQLGVDMVKIDKLFIDTIDNRRDAAPIVDSLIKLGHDLGMEVVAEGVETFEQLEYLRAHGADCAQGFLFSPPLPAIAFLDLVEAMEPHSLYAVGRDEESQEGARERITAKVA